MKRIILLLALITLAGCHGKELEQTKAILDDCDKNIKEVGKERDKLKKEVEDLQSQHQDVCSSIEEAAHAAHPQNFTVGEEDVSVPCAPTADDGSFKVRTHRTNPESGYAYLRYEINGNVKYSDRLYFEGNKSDRNALLIKDTTFSEPIVLSVNACENDTCDLTCQTLPSTHPTCE
jgi:hypothetical protein